jgi:hypothetical protein
MRGKKKREIVDFLLSVIYRSIRSGQQILLLYVKKVNENNFFKPKK